MVGFSIAYDSVSEYIPVKDRYLDNMPVTKARNLLKYILEKNLSLSVFYLLYQPSPLEPRITPARKSIRF